MSFALLKKKEFSHTARLGHHQRAAEAAGWLVDLLKPLVLALILVAGVFVGAAFLVIPGLMGTIP